MFKVFQDWLHRYFSDEQAVVLAVLLVLGFAAILNLGGMLAPVLTGLVLIVTGTADPVVPPAMTDELFAAAREPKRLLRIANAGHGGYTDAPGSTYAESVLAFFEQALLRRR